MQPLSTWGPQVGRNHTSCIILAILGSPSGQESKKRHSNVPTAAPATNNIENTIDFTGHYRRPLKVVPTTVWMWGTMQSMRIDSPRLASCTSGPGGGDYKRS